MVASYLCFAVGVGALAVALLLGGAGGTVAVADPDSSGSAAHGDDGINASGHQHSTGAKKPKDEPGATTSGTGAATSGTGATVTNVVAAVPGLAASVTNAVAPAPNLVGPVSDVNALIQDMLPSVAGAVVPVTQLQSELAFFLFGITGASSGRRGTYRQCCAVGVRAGVGGVGIAAAAGICRYPGYAGGRHRNRGCTARGIAASIFAAMTQVGEASSLPGLAQSFFRPASSELLLTGTGSLSGPAAPSGVAGLMNLNAAGVLPISLAALAALALPGAGALTILNAALGAPHKMGWPATPVGWRAVS